MGALLQFGGSLLAVLVLSAFVARLGLGREAPVLTDEEARRQAAGAIFGFEPVEVGLDKSGKAALLSDGLGRLVLVVVIGVHFATRQLGSATSARSENGLLAINLGELGFHPVSLDLGAKAVTWAKRIEALKT